MKNELSNGKKLTLFVTNILILSIIFQMLIPSIKVNASSPSYSGGDGSISNPYLISNEADLIALSDTTNNQSTNNLVTGKYFEMTNDIVLTQKFTPIGVGNTTNTAFEGYFDGNGHTITYSSSQELNKEIQYQGIFGLVKDAEIKGLNVKTSGDHSISIITAGNPGKPPLLPYKFGGVVGSAGGSSKIERCSFVGNIEIVYASFNGQNAPPNNEDISDIGGVVGAISDTSTISHSYSIIDKLTAYSSTANNGSFTDGGAVFFGGVVGRVYGNTENKIEYCYSILSRIFYKDDTDEFDFFGSTFRVGGVVGRFEQYPSLKDTFELSKSYYFKNTTPENTEDWFFPLEGDLVFFSGNYPEIDYSYGTIIDTSITDGSMLDFATPNDPDMYQQIITGINSAGGNYELGAGGYPVPIEPKESYSFLIEIPSKLDFTVDYKPEYQYTKYVSSCVVTAKDIELEPNQRIDISLKTNSGDLQLEADDPSKADMDLLTYHAYRPNTDEIYDFKSPIMSFTSDGSQTINFELEENQIVNAGVSYNGSIRYLVEVNEQ